MRLPTGASLAVRAVAAVVLLAVALVLGGILGSALVAAYALVATPGAGVVYGLYGIGGLVGVAAGASAVRTEVRAGRRRWLDGTRPADPDDRGRLVATVTRLAAGAGVEPPEVRVHPAFVPLAYTVHRREGAALVASVGLLSRLPPAELEAVLAHGIAHLASGDHRFVTWTLLPLVAAEEFYDGAADGGAAAITGDPAALAAALQRLDDAVDGPPREDLRQHARATDALNVLPSLDPAAGEGGLTGSHPPVEERIERLRALEREQEPA